MDAVTEIGRSFAELKSCLGESELVGQISHLMAKTTQISRELYASLQAIYSAKFPELGALNLLPVDYARLVRLIGNKTNLLGVDLSSILSPSMSLVVSMSVTTTGTELDESVLNTALKYCNEIIGLDHLKIEMLSTIEAHMLNLAPNLSRLVGTLTAARLLAVAGGLENLSKIPGGNIRLLGRMPEPGGMSRHESSILATTDLVNSYPSEHQLQVQKLLSNKCSLAARIDLGNASKDASRFPPPRDGAYGAKLRQQIVEKMERAVEPLPIKNVKPLPAPKEYPKRQRGGKRVRKLREQTATTEYQRLQNRMEFGKPEPEIVFGDSVKGLGMLQRSKKVRQDSRPTTHLIKRAKSRLGSVAKRQCSHKEMMVEDPNRLEQSSGIQSRYFDHV